MDKTRRDVSVTAKRSDFAQKLLDDLRLRKERMAAAATLAGAGCTSTEAYSCYMQIENRSSKNMPRQNIASRKRNTHTDSTSVNRSLAISDVSKQTVPTGRDQGKKQLGDLYMALTFAIENGEKHGKINSLNSCSMLGFLQKTGRGAILEFGKMERAITNRHQPSTSYFATTSQKVNPAFQACSQGMDYETCAIELGKKLLEGAMDLEDSLRMLVNAQETSEYMRKGTVKLLEVDEDEGDNIIGTDRPSFSFDNPQKNSPGFRKVPRTATNKTSSVLAYPSNTHNHVQQAVVPSNSASQEWSSTNEPGTKNFAASQGKKSWPSSSESKHEKRGIPNVIAKLMGLEEFPEPSDSASAKLGESNLKRKSEEVTPSNIEQKSRKYAETNQLARRTTKERVMNGSKTGVNQNTTFVSRADKERAISEMVIHEGKPTSKDSGMEKETKPIIVSKEATTKRNSLQEHIKPLDQIIGDRNIHYDERDKGEKVISRTKEAFPKNELQEMASLTHRHLEALHNERKIQANKRNISKILMICQHKPENDIELHRQIELLRSQPHDEKHQYEEKKNAKLRLQGKEKKGHQLLLNSSSKLIHGTLNSQERKSQVNQTTFNNRIFMEHIDKMSPEESSNVKYYEKIDKQKRINSTSRSSSQHPSSKNSEIGSQKSISKELQSGSTESATLHCPRDEHESLKETQKISQKVMAEISDGQRVEAPDLAQKCGPTPVDGAGNYSEMQERMAEDENRLKQILMTSKLFLDKAKPFFRFDDPFSIVHAGGPYSESEEDKIILDCGFEIMKRKGRRQELDVHLFLQISLSSEKIRTFDEFVKQLYKELRKLNAYGSNPMEGCDVVEYLAKMFERDVRNRDPDINCMWDAGWNDPMFEFTEKPNVIRDVEKHVLNRLINEITTEFYA